MERVWVREYAGTGDATYAAAKAGYSSPAKRGSDNLRSEPLMAQARALAMEKLNTVILPLAAEVHEKLLRSDTTPAGARAVLIKLAYDRAFGSDNEVKDKEPNEMTADELRRALEGIEAVKREIANRAAPVIENDEPSGVFG